MRLPSRSGPFAGILGALIMLGCWFAGLRAQAAEPARIAVLLLGDTGHHRPAELAKLLTPALARTGIDITYTRDLEDLQPATLAKYDALAIFRDSGDLPPKQEAALLQFVES